MIKFWVKLVQSGAKTIDEVPAKYREAVRRIAEAE